jgi:hypothetical protein
MTENDIRARGRTLTHYTITELAKSLKYATFERDENEARAIRFAIHLKSRGLVDGVLKYKV